MVGRHFLPPSFKLLTPITHYYWHLKIISPPPPDVTTYEFDLIFSLFHAVKYLTPLSLSFIVPEFKNIFKANPDLWACNIFTTKFSKKIKASITMTLNLLGLILLTLRTFSEKFSQIWSTCQTLMCQPLWWQKLLQLRLGGKYGLNIKYISKLMYCRESFWAGRVSKMRAVVHQVVEVL